MEKRRANIDYSRAFDEIDETAESNLGTLSELTDVELAVLAIRKKAQHKKFISMVQINDINDYDVCLVYANTQMLLKEQERRVNEMSFKYAPYQYVKNRSVEVTVGPRELVTLSREGVQENYKIDRGLIATGTEEDQMLLRAVTVVLSTVSMEVLTKTTVQGQLKTTEIMPADVMGNLLPSVPDTRLLGVIDFKTCFQGKTTMLDVRDSVLDHLSEGSKQMTATLLYYAHHKNISKDKEKYKNADCTYEIGVNVITRLAELEKKLAGKLTPEETRQVAATMKRVRDEADVAKQMLSAGLRPVIYKQPTVLRYPVISGLLKMWELIRSHREVRGENSKKISPFTNGMYYCDLAGDYRGVTASAALLSSMVQMNCQSILRIDQGYFKSAWNILELNTVVFRVGVNAEYEGQTHGTYSPAKPDINNKTLRVYMVGQQPTVTSKPKTMVQFTPPEQDTIVIVKSLLSQATRFMPVLVVTYGFPELWTHFNGQITAHAHAHAGVVNVYSTDIHSTYTYKQFLERTVAATVQKTYFPFTGKSWIAYDRHMIWPTVRVVRTKLKTVNILSNLTYYDLKDDQVVLAEDEVLDLPKTTFEAYETRVAVAAADVQAQQQRLHLQPSPVPEIAVSEERFLPPSTITPDEMSRIINGYDEEKAEWDT